MEEQEITTLTEYNALESHLRSLASEATLIQAPDKEMQKTLQKTRTRIEKIGKFLREDFTRMGKEVIAKEKELIGIIEPHEKRLKLLQEEADFAIERKYREDQFEARSERMAPLGLPLTADLNVGMDDTQFEAYFQTSLTAKNEAIMRDIEQREVKVREAEEAQKREADMKVREEKAREEEKARAEREIAEANARAERAVIAERERIEKQKALDEQEAKEKQAKLEADILYQTWLESHNWNDSIDFNIVRKEGKVYLYKLVDTLEI